MKLKVQTQFSDPKLDRLKNGDKPTKYFLTLRNEIVKKKIISQFHRGEEEKFLSDFK